MAHPSLFDDTHRDNDNVLFDVDMAGILGAFHQLIYTSAYITETLDSLIQLSEDVHERVESISKRTTALMQKLPSFEARVLSMEVNEYGHSGLRAKNKFLQQRDAYIPTVLSRSTNSPQVMAQYHLIQPLPPFWKLVPVTQQDTSNFYSHPGLIRCCMCMSLGNSLRGLFE